MWTVFLLAQICLLAVAADPVAADAETSRLVVALLGETPLIENLRALTDEVGGRPTGSAANRRSVEWGLERFREAGVTVTREAFEMPARWLERSASARISGDVDFAADVAAMPFSAPTKSRGVKAPLLDGAAGTDEDFSALGESARGAWLLIETELLEDVDGLFREYIEAADIERRAFAAGVTGLIYMGSRPRGVLHRHNASLGPGNRHPLVVMERPAAQRALRLLRGGHRLDARITLDLDTGPAYEAFNVIGEIPGTAEPEEFVVIGAHLDSWGLGTGALDNGCNVALVIDIARQMQRLGIRPRRTIRFALWNGEEQGLHGSLGYVRSHADEMDRHVMASSYDIGSGAITGFFTGGRPEILRALEPLLDSVQALGPFTQIDVPIVGTDNFDFMMEGVANLVANQASSNYGPNYHASTDTFDRVDQTQLRRNAAIAAAVTLGFAQMEVDWTRQSREELTELIESTDLGQQMKTFGLWSSWESGERGRTD